MLASATLTTVLSRKVRNSSVHRETRASGRRREVRRSVAAGVSASVTLSVPAGSGQLGTALGVLQVGQPAEARDGHLPDAAQVDRRAYLVLQQRRVKQQKIPVHGGLRGRRDDHRADRRGRPRRGLPERRLGGGLDERGQLRTVL